VASDPRQLRPGELCRLLNSTPLGEVISERQLHRHRTRAGLRICSGDDQQRIDALPRLVGHHEAVSAPTVDAAPCPYSSPSRRLRVPID